MKAYAGIGSRETPDDVLVHMYNLAKQLAERDYTLYSGGAEGADTAFEAGADKKLIFIPWDGFNHRRANGIDTIIPPYNYELVEYYHTHPHMLSRGAKLLMSRNSYQVLGPDLNSPVEFVLCWTKDGQFSGGTGQAMRIAHDKGIHIVNMRNSIPFKKWLVDNDLTI